MESRVRDVVDLIYSSDNAAAVMETVIAQIRDCFGLKNIAYLGTGFTKRPEEEPVVKSTYSNEWVSLYRAEHYAHVDPVLRCGLNDMLPFCWSTLPYDNQDIEEFFFDATRYGVGANGVTVPLRGMWGSRAMMSFTADCSIRDWRHFCHHSEGDLAYIGLIYHERIVRRRGVHVDGKLSRREVDCLKWASVGKTASETAIILGIPERTVRRDLETCQKKLEAANITHAVTKAIYSNLMTPSW